MSASLTNRITGLRPKASPVAYATLNGDPLLMAVDRALVELRRGRVVVLEAASPDQPPVLITALETASAALIAQLRELDGRGPYLAITPERARALGLGSGREQPVLLRSDPDSTAEQLAALGESAGKPTFGAP